jgi:hypothetical protein
MARMVRTPTKMAAFFLLIMGGSPSERCLY